MARHKKPVYVPSIAKKASSAEGQNVLAPKLATSKVVTPKKPLQVVTTKTHHPHHPEKKQDVRDANGKPIIWVDIERGNRVMVKWAADLEGITLLMTYDEERPTSIWGNIEDLHAQNAKKKLIPCNYDNAWKLIQLLKNVQSKDFTGRPIYDIQITDEFSDWFDGEHEANKLCEDASAHLKYDEATVQRDYPFLKVRLYPWQGPCFQFLNAVTKQGRGAFLCDETGLGKTIEIASHLASSSYKAVVVCPAGLRHSWARKIEATTNLTTVVVGNKFPYKCENYDVIIVSYAMLKKYGAWPLSEVIEGQRRVLVLDEGQAAKNYDSMRTMLCVALSHGARHSIVVTATPLKNRVEDLHPLLRITRRLWTEASFEAFKKMYSTPESQEEIAEHLSRFMVRRMSEDVWKDAPKVEVAEAWVDLTNRSDYAAAEADFIEWLKSRGADVDRLEAAERGLALVKLNALRKLSATGKMQGAHRLIEQTMNHNEQCVVFCAFNDPLQTLANSFATKTGLNYKGQAWQGAAVIIGATPEEARNQYIDRFMQGKIGLLCIGTNAGGVGIDLPIARYGFHLDLPWTPADFEQCTGRLKRIGQERDCQFFKLLAPSTIDQRMEEIIQVKANTFKRAIGDKGIVERVTGRDPGSLQDTVVTALLRSYMR